LLVGNSQSATTLGASLILMRSCLVLALLGTIAVCAPAYSGARDLALVGAKIYPSSDDSPIENGSIVIHDGKVQALGPAQSIRIPSDATRIECKNLTVTAGFWNSHVHIITPALLHAKESGAADLNTELDRMFNRWGFTTVFDLASELDNTLALRRRIETGELRGPHILTAGEPIWTIEPVYVRAFLLENHIQMRNTETPDEAVALVRDHFEKGANGIKLFTGSYQGGDKVANLPLPVAEASVKEAHKHGMPVFAHPQNLRGIEIAIDSGVDVLAHTVPQSPPWTPGFCARLKRARLALIPTLTLFDFEARDVNPQEREHWVAQMVAELRAYLHAGGDVLFGTDIGYTDRYDTALEFTLMSRAGMNYRQILASLTTNPARRFGRSGRIGPGLPANLTVLNADPAKDPAAFSKVHYTIRTGEIIYRAQ
jgi:imidazolonepropionase-like amidohydrolase